MRPFSAKAFYAWHVGRETHHFARQQRMMLHWDMKNVGQREVIYLICQSQLGNDVTHIEIHTYCTTSPTAANSSALITALHCTHTMYKDRHRYLTSIWGLHELQQDDIFHPDYLWIVMTPTWIPFHPHEVICLSEETYGSTLAAVHLSRRTSSCLSESKRKSEMYLTLSRGMERRCGLFAAVKDIFCQCPGALCNLTLPLLPMPPTLSSWCGLCALSDITADTRQRERAERYYSLTFLCLFQPYQSSSSPARHMLCKVCGAKSGKLPLEKDIQLWMLSVTACKWTCLTVNQ